MPEQRDAPADLGGQEENNRENPVNRQPGCDLTPSHQNRRIRSKKIRVAAADRQSDAGRIDIKCNKDNLADCNGDEVRYASENFFASYTKGLPHDNFGEVLPNAYNALLQALETTNQADFNNISLGCDPAADDQHSLTGHFMEFSTRFSTVEAEKKKLKSLNAASEQRRLVNPQSAVAFDLEGADSHRFRIRPAPAFASDEAAAEMAELYWMALARDVCVSDYGSNAITKAAVADLKRYPLFKNITGKTLFRGEFDGDQEGPYFSQFLYANIPFGAQQIDPRIRTVKSLAEGGCDFMTDFQSWLNVQNGCMPEEMDRIKPGKRVFIRNGRDIGQYVHVDVLYQAYFNAMLILLTMPSPASENAGIGAAFDENNPYVNPNPSSRNQEGFGTFGGPHIATLVAEVATRALKAVWFQKWRVHRRLRPEEFAGRIEAQANQNARKYPVNAILLNSALLGRIKAHNALQNKGKGSFLLPMAFPEGSPIHPSYGSGHATVAGACVTMLKAWFQDGKFPKPKELNAACTDLEDYKGSMLTIHGELNKLASNIAIGRSHAGVHWRSDYRESLLLGEQVAIELLEDTACTYNEPFKGFTFKNFCGKEVRVGGNQGKGRCS